MRVVEWSGHPVGDAQPGIAGSQSQLGQRSEVFGPASDQEHHIGSRLLDPLAARHARQRAHAEDLAGSASAAEIKGARKLGARHAVTDLQHLGDDWLLIRGLQTTAGPIGQLLLGSPGLIALTSLYLAATVHCRGDKWHAEKELKPRGLPGDRGEHHDRQHESTMEMSLDDPAGRSPSVELNQAADTLEGFLRSGGVQLRVERVVLVNHPRPGEDQWHRPTVHVFGSTSNFLSWLHKLPKILDRGQKRQIENLVVSGDHHHPQAVQELAENARDPAL
jgi:hypothetical protein